MGNSDMRHDPEESPQFVLDHLDPSRIRLQRERAGLTGKRLAKKVGLSPSAISQIERGVTDPDLETLMRISLALKVPVRFFAERDTNTRIPLDRCHFRSNRSVAQYERRKVLGDASLLVQLVDVLEGKGVQFPTENISNFSDDTSVVDENTPVEKMEDLAVQLRKHWGMGLGPIPNLVSLLESKGILILPIADAPEKMDAFSAWEKERPVIVLTQRKAASRDRLDASHELGHLVVHGDDNPGLSIFEKQAFRFGAAFLAPRPTFAEECPRKWSYTAFEQLKKRWKMSISALVRRAYDIGYLSQSSYRKANIYLKEQLQNQGGETAEWETEKPVMIQQSLELLKDRCTLKDLANDVGTHPPDLRQLLSLSVDSSLLDELSFGNDKGGSSQIVSLRRSETESSKRGESSG